jgi:hypothetical protein
MPPRLYTKEAAIEAGVHVSTGKDVIDAVNELHALTHTDSGLTLEALFEMIKALQNGGEIPQAPESPVLSYSGLLYNAVTLNWTDPSNTNNFEIYNGTTLLGTSTVTTAEITLVPEASYQLTVRSVLGNLKSAASNAVSVTTPAEPITLSAPIHTQVIGTDSITFTATNRPAGASWVMTFGGVEYTSTTDTLEITGLSEGTAYDYSSVYVLAGVTGPVSDIATITTDTSLSELFLDGQSLTIDGQPAYLGETNA